jgi:hypothetical protein
MIWVSQQGRCFLILTQDNAPGQALSTAYRRFITVFDAPDINEFNKPTRDLTCLDLWAFYEEDYIIHYDCTNWRDDIKIKIKFLPEDEGYTHGLIESLLLTNFRLKMVLSEGVHKESIKSGVGLFS